MCIRDSHMSETFLFVPDSTFPSADQEKNRQDYLPAYSEKAPSSAEAGLPAPSAVILLRKDRVRGHLKSGMEKELSLIHIYRKAKCGRFKNTGRQYPGESSSRRKNLSPCRSGRSC